MRVKRPDGYQYELCSKSPLSEHSEDSASWNDVSMDYSPLENDVDWSRISKAFVSSTVEYDRAKRGLVPLSETEMSGFGHQEDAHDNNMTWREYGM